MRTRIFVVLAALAAAFAVGPAGPAHARVGPQTVLAVSASDSIDAKSVVAYCPRGTVLPATDVRRSSDLLPLSSAGVCRDSSDRRDRGRS